MEFSIRMITQCSDEDLALWGKLEFIAAAPDLRGRGAITPHSREDDRPRC